MTPINQPETKTVSEQANKNLLRVIIGPTAVGKTEISIQLAERIGGEIVSADSRTFYRGMNIGTAKPTPEDQLRVPHHLIDVADPDQPWSLAVFQREAYLVIDAVHASGHLPILIGGTGQYVRSVADGWEIPEVQPDPTMREVLENWTQEIGPDGLHDRLAVLDPRAADKIDPSNQRRSVRALEVILSTGKRFSEQRRRGTPKYDVVMIGLSRPREELYQRIDSRIERMLEDGLVEEVKRLLDRGYSPDLSVFSAIGYREIIQYLIGGISLDEAVIQMKRHTRMLVRRQANWFKPDDPNIRWFKIHPGTVGEMEKFIRETTPDYLT